jgi:hypothetical protein
MTENFNFLIEIEEKFDSEVYGLMMETFDALPLAVCLLLAHCRFRLARAALAHLLLSFS